VEGYKLQRPRLPTLYHDIRRTNNSNIFLLFLRRMSRYSVVSLGRYSFFPSTIDLRIYQHPFVTLERRKCSLYAVWRCVSRNTIRGELRATPQNSLKCIIRCNFKCGLNVRLLGVGMASEEGCSKLMGTDSRCAHICLP